MTEFYDSLETRDPEIRERALFKALPDQIAHAKANAAHFSKLLKDIDPQSISSRAALAKLPVTRKSALHELQKGNPPFGGLAAGKAGQLAKIFVSPGPIFDAEGRGVDFWRTARALFACGFRSGHIVQNCFSYHLTPAGSMFETGLLALGCAVVPGGVGQTEMQVAAMADLSVDGYVGTPSFLKLILEKADHLGRDIKSMAKAHVSGEAFLPAQREMFGQRGINAFQSYGTADLGIIAYETEAHEGLVIDEGVIVEIVRPGTGDPVSEGEVGEVVVTTFNRDYPLIRFATGDLSAALPGWSEKASPCGRTNMRIKGWMGRADQTTKVRGMFVHPHQVADVAKRFPVIQRVRVVVENPDGSDRMRVCCAVMGVASDDLRNQIASAVRETTKLRGDVEFVAIDTLPNDGKVIEDAREIA
jgi:phenylacetate-CoA ligase